MISFSTITVCSTDVVAPYESLIVRVNVYSPGSAVNDISSESFEDISVLDGSTVQLYSIGSPSLSYDPVPSRETTIVAVLSYES